MSDDGWKCTDIEVKITIRIPGHIDAEALKQKIERDVTEVTNLEVHQNGIHDAQVIAGSESRHTIFFCKELGRLR